LRLLGIHEADLQASGFSGSEGAKQKFTRPFLVIYVLRKICHKLVAWTSSGSRDTPPWETDIVETHALGNFGYLEKLAKYQRDPHRWPCPLPPEGGNQDVPFD
jgi:hypothetical protein